MEENHSKRKRNEGAPNEGEEKWEDESAETTTNTKDEDSTMARKMLGNREAVRKYRARKKALTVRLEQEVQDLRVLTGHLIYRLHRQGQVEKDLERLRSVIIEVRRRLDMPRDEPASAMRAEIASLIDDLAFDVVGACYANKTPPLVTAAPGFWPGSSAYMPHEGALGAPAAMKAASCNPFSSSYATSVLGPMSAAPGMDEFRPPPTYSFMDDSSNGALLAAAGVAAGGRSLAEKAKLPPPVGLPTSVRHHGGPAALPSNPGSRGGSSIPGTSGLGLSLASSADSPASKYLGSLGVPTGSISSHDSYATSRSSSTMGMGAGAGGAPMGRAGTGPYGMPPNGSATQVVARMGMDVAGSMHGPGQGHPNDPSSMMSSQHAAAAAAAVASAQRLDLGVNPLSLGTTYSWGMTLSSGVGGCRDLNNLVDNSLNY